MSDPMCSTSSKLQPKAATCSFQGVHVDGQTCKTTGHTVTKGRDEFDPYLCLGSRLDKTRIYTQRDMVGKAEKHTSGTEKNL